jgi:hypothetical protein
MIIRNTLKGDFAGDVSLVKVYKIYKCVSRFESVGIKLYAFFI